MSAALDVVTDVAKHSDVPLAVDVAPDGLVYVTVADPDASVGDVLLALDEVEQSLREHDQFAMLRGTFGIYRIGARL